MPFVRTLSDLDCCTDELAISADISAATAAATPPAAAKTTALESAAAAPASARIWMGGA